MSQNTSLLDSVILVDETDHPIGTMDKYEAHRNGGHLHRAISVYLFAKVQGKWQLLIQQRSPQKIVGGKMWANTVCGNVRPGESYRECATRRLREELGLQQSTIEATGLEAIYTFQYAVKCNEEFSEREIDRVFVGQVRATEVASLLVPNTSEVIATDWIDFMQLVNDAREQDWRPENTVVYKDKKMAPWFVWMVRDESLVSILQQTLQEQTK